VVCTRDQLVNRGAWGDQEIVFTEKCIGSFAKFRVALAERSDFGERNGGAPGESLGDGLLEVRKIATGSCGVNGGSFVSLDRREDIDRAFPELRVYR